MLIIAGKLCVHPHERDRWVAAHDEITRTARSQPGCLAGAAVRRCSAAGQGLGVVERKYG